VVVVELIVHEFFAPALREGRGHRRRTAMQCPMLSPPNPRAKLHAMEPVQPTHALDIHRPRFPAQQHPPRKARARPGHGEVANAAANAELIRSAVLPMPRRSTELGYRVRILDWHPERGEEPRREDPACRQLQAFHRRASMSMCLFGVRSRRGP
jgi:hypothetical protein